MWNGKRVSVVLMTYAERDSIREVIENFLATGLVDEVLVVDNNAQQGTREEVARTEARLVHEPEQGYGHAIRRGLLEATGELIVLAEPDGTFLPQDIIKLLVYSGECDVGCTYRLLRGETAREIAQAMTVGGSHAGVEIMLLTILSGARFVEVPVNYLPRVGTSSVTGRPIKAVQVGMAMIAHVLKLRWGTPRGRTRPPAFVHPERSQRERPRRGERLPL